MLLWDATKVCSKSHTCHIPPLAKSLFEGSWCLGVRGSWGPDLLDLPLSLCIPVHLFAAFLGSTNWQALPWDSRELDVQTGWVCNSLNLPKWGLPSCPSLLLFVFMPHPPTCPHAGGGGWWEDVVQPPLSLSPSRDKPEGDSYYWSPHWIISSFKDFSLSQVGVEISNPSQFLWELGVWISKVIWALYIVSGFCSI